jgi:hypothetical protein
VGAGFVGGRSASGDQRSNCKNAVNAQEVKMSQYGFGLTPEDLALAEGDAPDLAIRARSQITLVQSNSPELVSGDKRHVKGATVGSFVIPQGEERVAVDHVDFIAVGFSHYYDEYLPSRGPFVEIHLKKPPGAIWLDAKRDGVEKTGLYLPSGNRVVEVILTYLVMTGGQGASFAFYGSGFPVGRDLSDRAASLKATVGTSSVHSCTLGKWRLTATFEKKDNDRYCKPYVALLGKLGEPNGPTVDEWRQAQTLRRAFKDGVPWQEALADFSAALPAPKPKLAVVHSGNGETWADGTPVPTEAPDGPDYDPDGGHYPDEEEVGF